MNIHHFISQENTSFINPLFILYTFPPNNIATQFCVVVNDDPHVEELYGQNNVNTYQ